MAVKKNNYLWVLLIITFLSLQVKFSAFGQEIKVELGKNQIALNEAFTISVVVENARIRSYEGFPEINGFIKQGVSRSSSTNVINGQITSRESIIQNYTPTAEGTYTVPAFVVTVNGKTASSSGTTVQVGPPRQSSRQRDPFFDPFDSFFDNDEPPEYVDLKEDAFFSLTVDKNEVYLGEGFLMTLAFYIAETNQAPMQFHNLGQQLSRILKEVKPANCWEEDFEIERVNGIPVTIRGKRYTQYKLYQAAFYPLNLDPINIPSVGMEMIKYQLAKNPSFFGRNRKEEIKTFFTSEKSVRVKPLPPHPLRDNVAVGVYELDEKISDLELETGKSFSYQFTVMGEGNISAIDKPRIPANSEFDFYPPNVRQRINRGDNRVTGTKSFNYYSIPNEPGEYRLGDYFYWVYFDPKRSKYDTLRSQIVVQAVGESKKNQHISSSDMGTFYDVIELENNRLTDRNRDDKVKLFANIIIFLMLALTIFILFKS